MEYTKKTKATILLEDGSMFFGNSVGFHGIATGEVCFNTGMTGYQEVFTDPSYYHQIMITTNAHIGNYGTDINEYEALSKAGFKIIQLTLDPEIQKRRIKKVYPNNYQDHFNNTNHISERNEFQWLKGDNPLIIDSGNENILDIMEKINNYL